MSEKSYLYTVHPKRAITGLTGIKVIRTPKSLMLTKEDVKTCLQKASVYRRFALDGKVERVTVGNIDRIHNERYISEEDWIKNGGNADTISDVADEVVVEEKKIEEVKEERGTVVPGTDETPEEKSINVESNHESEQDKQDGAEAEEPKEEIQADHDIEPEVVEDTTENSPAPEEAANDEAVETEEEVQAEPTNTEDEESDDTSESTQSQDDNGNQYVKYNKNKKKR